MKRPLIFIALILCALVTDGQIRMSVNTGKPSVDIKPEMHGVFFEDINFGADGGIYAELIKNRSFEFDHPFVGWIPFGDVVLRKDDPCFERNPNYVRLTGKELLTGTGLINEGFTGIGIKKGEEYRLSFFARAEKGKTVRLLLEIINADHEPIEKKRIEVTGNAWQQHSAVLKSRLKSDQHCKFRLSVETDGYIDIDHISLFPVRTWKGRGNGLRQDLVQTLYDMHPGVLRFPGGCIVEGNSLETRYRWKRSIGPVENRPININRWNFSNKKRLFPDYYQSYGLGFYEYFVLSEDLGATPLPVINCGMACQFACKEVVPLDELGPYIQDALDLIEFANGAVTTKWGKIRADMGHPEPFNMKYLGIGNEQWGQAYVERFERFADAISKKYPEIILIGSTGPKPDGEDFEYLSDEMKRVNATMVDEHFYASPEWFFGNAGRYDHYDRKGSRVFAGEFAAHSENRVNNFESAIAEAAFMTGLERNADVVQMATYAPLFAHVDAWQWRPDMIWFDNFRVVKTPNYYVQKLYATNAGTHILPVVAVGYNLKGEKGIYANAVIDKEDGAIIVKVVNSNARGHELILSLTREKQEFLKSTVKITFIQSDDLRAENTLENPYHVIPKELRGHSVIKNTLKLDLLGNSFYVIRVETN